MHRNLMRYHRPNTTSNRGRLILHSSIIEIAIGQLLISRFISPRLSAYRPGCRHRQIVNINYARLSFTFNLTSDRSDLNMTHMHAWLGKCINRMQIWQCAWRNREPIFLAPTSNVNIELSDAWNERQQRREMIELDYWIAHLYSTEQLNASIAKAFINVIFIIQIKCAVNAYLPYVRVCTISKRQSVH